MFPDLSWSHMLLVLVVALVVVGPRDLPKLMRKLGQWTARARDMADQFRNSFDEMARQSELDELRKEIDELRKVRPLTEARDEIERAMKLPDISLDPKAASQDLPEEAPDALPEALPHAPAPPPESAPAPAEGNAPTEGGRSASP